jgi:hypothetical protein
LVKFLLYALHKVGDGGVVASLAYHTPLVFTYFDGELLSCLLLQRLFSFYYYYFAEVMMLFAFASPDPNECSFFLFVSTHFHVIFIFHFAVLLLNFE